MRDSENIMSFDEGLGLFKSAHYKASSEQFAAITKTDENNHKAWNDLRNMSFKIKSI